MTPSAARLRVAIQVRSHRRAQKLSQEALGERAGIHRTYVGEIERGEANVTIDHVQKLADALQIDVVELLRPSTELLKPS